MIGKRLYMQLQPDEHGQNTLRAIQAQLTPQTDGRMIGASELHMTLIHFGSIEEAFNKTHAECGVVRDDFDDALTQYVRHCEALMHGQTFDVAHTGYALFGPKQKTLVATFEASQSLIERHAESLNQLKRFFRAVNINDVDTFMQNDANFVHTLTLDPHTTLFKGYIGTTPTKVMGSMTFQSMPVLYD